MNHNNCTAYQFDHKSKKCSKCSVGLIEPASTNSSTEQDGELIESGLCPKVKDELKNLLTPVSRAAKSEYWCLKGTKELCNFPFRLEEEDGLHYSPVTEQGIQKCINGSFKSKGSNTFNRTDLQECSRCHGNFFL